MVPRPAFLYMLDTHMTYMVSTTGLGGGGTGKPTAWRLRTACTLSDHANWSQTVRGNCRTLWVLPTSARHICSSPITKMTISFSRCTKPPQPSAADCFNPDTQNPSCLHLFLLYSIVHIQILNRLQLYLMKSVTFKYIDSKKGLKHWV